MGLLVLLTVPQGRWGISIFLGHPVFHRPPQTTPVFLMDLVSLWGDRVSLTRQVIEVISRLLLLDHVVSNLHPGDSHPPRTDSRTPLDPTSKCSVHHLETACLEEVLNGHL